MKIRHADNPNICYTETDAVTLWTCGIVEFRVDTQDRKFILTPVMRDKSEGSAVDATEMREKFTREQL